MTWAGKRKTLISSFLIVFVVFPILYFAFIKIKPTPTCTDRRKNGTETGIDCGGSCQLFCPYERKDIVVIFSRAQKIVDGLYNVVALVENKNVDALSPYVRYKFKLYDDHNIPIAVREGYTYINPNIRQAIFESGIDVGRHNVGRVVFEIEKPITWLRTDMGSYVLPLSISEPDYKISDEKPILNYLLQNNSFEKIPKGTAVVIAYDTNNNAIGFSKTIIDELKPSEKQIIVFSWPYVFSKDNLRFELYPQVDLSQYNNK